MRLVMEFSREDLNRLQYPIIVENWEKVKSCGSKKRRWLAEFTEPERKLLSEYYKIFYDWYLRRGTPERFVFRKGSTVDLIHRAVAFFASV
jgi:hypothetical protein